MKLHFKKFLILISLKCLATQKHLFLGALFDFDDNNLSHSEGKCEEELGEQTDHGIYASPSPPRPLTGRTEIQIPRVFRQHLVLTFILQPASRIEGGTLHILLFTTLL